MSVVIDPPPDILLYFKGMLVLSIANGQPSCKVGLLRKAEGHKLLVQILKFSKEGPSLVKEFEKSDLGKTFSLEVQNTSRKKIELFTTRNFERNGGNNDCHDFQWVLDFEGQEVYKEEVELDRRGFNPVFDIRSHGRYFTQKISRDKLKIEGEAGILGPVATHIAALIWLDNPSGEATFNDGKGGNPIPIKREKGALHRILVSQSRSDHQHGNDSLLYDQAIIRGKFSRKRIHFQGVREAHELCENPNNETGDCPIKAIVTANPLLAAALESIDEDLHQFRDRLSVLPADPMAVCLTTQISRSPI